PERPHRLGGAAPRRVEPDGVLRAAGAGPTARREPRVEVHGQALTAHAMPIQEEPHPVADIGDRIEDPGVEQELLALWDEWTGPVEEVHLGEDPLVRGDRQSLHGSPGGPAPSSDVEARD